MAAPVTSVDFHFDIMCPWAFQASVWMRDVRDRLGLEVRWCFFSLEEINRAEGKKHPWQREWSYGWSMMRIGALLRRIDPGLLDRWYLAAGTSVRTAMPRATMTATASPTTSSRWTTWPACFWR